MVLNDHSTLIILVRRVSDIRDIMNAFADGIAVRAILCNVFKIFYLWVQDDPPCTGFIGTAGVERTVEELRQFT